MVKSATMRRWRGAPPIRTFLLFLFAGILGFHVGFDWHLTTVLHEEEMGHAREQQPVDTSPGSKAPHTAASPVFEHSLQKAPLISVVLLTGGRLELARDVLSRIIKYLSVREPSVAYDLVWVDNGVSNRTASLEMEQLFSFEQVLRYGYNSGIGRALNNAFFISRAPYILLLEEDWWLSDSCFQENSTRCPTFVGPGIKLLSKEARAIRLELVPSVTRARANKVDFSQCSYSGNRTDGWGAWSNRPSIVSKERFLTILKGFDETILAPLLQEHDLSRRANKAQMCSFPGRSDLFSHKGAGNRSPLNNERAPAAKISYLVPEVRVYQMVGQL